mmetsp:Transcript_17472/g.48472  ORF Transcript_17472/g.48472 Transcript_17472/m.48472 type:complete len:142 (-) Transcript_17472:821-1246(-)
MPHESIHVLISRIFHLLLVLLLLLLHPDLDWTKPMERLHCSARLRSTFMHSHVMIRRVANPSKLRNTDIGDAVKSGEDLAAPITYTPFKNDDHTNYVANPTKLKTTQEGELVKSGGNLAAPITHIRKVKKKKKKKKAAPAS